MSQSKPTTFEDELKRIELHVPEHIGTVPPNITIGDILSDTDIKAILKAHNKAVLIERIKGVEYMTPQPLEEHPFNETEKSMHARGLAEKNRLENQLNKGELKK